MLGFVNGLAIIIFLAQMEQFKTVDGSWITGIPAMVMGGLILLTMAIMHFLPKYTKSIPSGLAAIGTVTLLALYVPDINTHAKTIAGYLADNDSVLKGGLPQFFNPFAHIST
jgi:SulP family sulfate permease